jgi:hypothetical protein
MSKPVKGAAGQMALGGLGEGSVVALDGGRRMRLDDRVDFWPATQAWKTVVDGPDGPASGTGFTSLLDYLKRVREAAGSPVAAPVARKSDREVICDYCGRHADLFGGLDVYPDRKDLADRQFWVCWSCDAWVGCKKDTDEPFGALADEALRAARIAAHRAFDPIWEQELMTKLHEVGGLRQGQPSGVGAFWRPSNITSRFDQKALLTTPPSTRSAAPVVAGMAHGPMPACRQRLRGFEAPRHRRACAGLF